MTASSLPPAAILIVGALFLPLVRGRVRQALVVLLPVLSCAHLLALGAGPHLAVELFDYDLVIARVDKLSLLFGLVFHIAALLAGVYSLHLKKCGQQVAGLVYAGAAVFGSRKCLPPKPHSGTHE